MKTPTFALPLSWPVAIARVALVAASWSSLDHANRPRTPSDRPPQLSTRADRA